MTSELDVSVAGKFITGTFAKGQQTEASKLNVSNLAEENKLNTMTEEAQGEPESKRISELIAASKAEGMTDIEDQFNRERGRAIDEAGAFSRQPGFMNTLNLVDERKSRAVGDLIKGLRTRQAELGFEGDKFAFQKNMGAAELGLRRQGLLQSIRDAREGASLNAYNMLREESLAEKIGRQRAEANKPTWMDYARLGIGAAGAAGGLGAGAAAVRTAWR